MTDGIPSSLVGNDLRRIADALEGILDLKRKELTGEIQPHWAKPKPADKWIACRLELVRVLDHCPFYDWTRAKENAVLRDPNVGNMYREHQWRRYLNQHAIPNKPDDGSGVVIIALGKADKDGPAVCTSERNRH